MKNYLSRIALLTAFTISAIQASAQMPYTVTVANQPYQPLNTATAVNAGQVWTDADNYIVPLPFSFKINGTATNQIAVIGGNFIAGDTAGLISGFGMMGTVLRDRGTASTKSPIRYTVSGAAGSRIFKLETSNAGFDAELAQYGTLNDSTQLQIWLYEGTNVAEIRYGGSQVSHFSDYFDGGVVPVGFIRNMKLADGSFQKAYLLKGNPGTPTVDSMSLSQPQPVGLSAVPSNGMVYRFTPKSNGPTGVPVLTAGTLGKVYPTHCFNTITIEHRLQEPLAYHIISMNGASLGAGQLGAGTRQVDVSSLVPGMYLVRLVHPTGAEVQRFVKL